MIFLSKLLAWFFTAIYFFVFVLIINFIINSFIDIGFAQESFLAIFCWIIAFFASVGLGDFTEKKIKEYYSKK